jgi:bifunctional non-homologous end joining protein LigD
MLQDYDRKRDFEETPEPKGVRKKTRRGKVKPLEFVIQKHSASRLHFDFRLEIDGVLVSWAVPKGPSLNPDEKRLAVHVEDHPFEYRKFEGIIPARQYGAGEVIVWDKGTYEPVDGANLDRGEQQKLLRKSLGEGKLSIEMHGEKLNGIFALVEMKGRGENQWLLIKKDDDYADPDCDIASDDSSVLSDLTLNGLKEKNGKPSTKTKAASSPKKTKPREKKSVTRREKMPVHVEPMLTKTANEPFSKPGWIYEPKLDGIRSIAYIKDDEVRLISRRGLNLTERYPSIEKELAKINDSLILDGEITAIDKDGHPSFQLLQRAGQVTRLTKDTRIVYYVFDILYADGRCLFDEPLATRREILKEKLKSSDFVKAVSDLGADGLKAFRACVEMDLEGIVAKRLDSVYRTGYRTSDWLKIKSFKSAEFLISGFSAGTGSRSDNFGSLLLGYYDADGELVYAGSVGTGFNNQNMTQLMTLMKPLERKSPPFSLKIRRKKDVTWLAPKLVAEIKFAEWTADGMLRHPVFLRLREDIEPIDVVRHI